MRPSVGKPDAEAMLPLLKGLLQKRLEHEKQRRDLPAIEQGPQ